MNDIYFGIDIGGTNIKYGLFIDEELIIKESKKTPKIEPQKNIVKQISKTIKEILKNNNYSLNSLKGIGLTFPGIITNQIILDAANIKINGVFDPVTSLKKEFSNINIKIGNDANLACYGEFSKLDMNINNMFLITLGTGVGGGLVINKKLYEGSQGAAGEVGHMIINPNSNTICGCGNKGCLEVYGSTKGFVNNTKKLIKNNKTTLKTIKNLNPKSIIDEAKKGDKIALKALDNYTNYLAMAAANVALLFDPDVIMFGGGISMAGNFLLNKIKNNYKKHARFNTIDKELKLAKLGNDAGMYGAMYYVKNN